MGSKGRKAQLQVEVNSTEELTIFLDQDNLLLLVLDVYTECYGPCKSMVACLKKLKSETDKLQLAIVKCDNIKALRRFRGRSEPVWLFVFDGKVINSFFGCNIPAMVQQLKEELEFCGNADEKLSRKTFELSQMTAVEAEINKSEKLTAILKKRADAEEAKLKAREHIEYVFDEIESHAEGSGVTIFMPHVLTRDLYKKVLQVGESLQLTVRERTNAIVTTDHLKIINFNEVNMPPVLIDHINAKEVLMICWKIPDDELKPVEFFLNQLKDVVTKKTNRISVVDEELEGEEKVEEVAEPEETGLTLKSLSIIAEQKCVETFVRLNSINVDLIDDELEFIRYVINFAIDYATNNIVDTGKMGYLRMKLAHMLNVSENDERFIAAMDMIDQLIEDVVGTDETDHEVEVSDLKETDQKETVNEEIENTAGPVGNELLNAQNAVDEFSYDPSQPTRARIPPVWTPSNKRANAALIYLYFRVLTEHFLDPDPVPDPPHVLMVFSARKWTDVVEATKPYDGAVLSFGYFDSSDWTQANILATSHSEYKKLRPNSNDRLILKVTEESDATLMLAGLIPDYVSQNDIEGKIECEQAFPAGYKNAEEEEEEEKEEEEEEEEGKEGGENGSGNENASGSEGDTEEELNNIDDDDNSNNNQTTENS